MRRVIAMVVVGMVRVCNMVKLLHLSCRPTLVCLVQEFVGGSLRDPPFPFPFLVPNPHTCKDPSIAKAPLSMTGSKFSLKDWAGPIAALHAFSDCFHVHCLLVMAVLNCTPSVCLEGAAWVVVLLCLHFSAGCNV
jgi:hypothetical protein